MDTRKDLQSILGLVGCNAYKKTHFQISILGHFGLETSIDRDSPAVIQFNTDSLKAEVTGEGTAANAHQQNVTGERLALATSCSFHTNQWKHQNGQKHQMN